MPTLSETMREAIVQRDDLPAISRRRSRTWR
jgi:hypothetical protein